jgi:hypothetical protein
MTDLIKRLQYLSRVAKDYDQEDMTSADYEMIPAATKQAADRIEELAEDNRQLINSLMLINVAWDQALGQRDAAEAKLTKAMEVLQLYAGGVTSAVYARTVLAEIEREKIA